MSTQTTSTLRERILATSDNSPSLRESLGPSLAEHLSRSTLRPLSEEVSRWHKQASEPLLVAAKQLSATSEALRSAFTLATTQGRKDLAHLQRNAHRLTRSRARLSFRLLEFLESLCASGKDYTAHLVSQAVLGDAEARRYWTEQAATGNETALAVVALLEDLDSFTEEVPRLLDLASEVIAQASRDGLDLDTSGSAPPLDLMLCGSVFRNAP